MISHLSLYHFRSHLQSDFDFDPNLTLILGPNGSGKTNLLDAIYFLSCGKSFHSTTSSLISWNQLQTSIIGDNYSRQEIRIIKLSSDARPSLQFYIDSAAKKRRDYLGNLTVVVFQPEDIRLVSGSPARRRRFLDDLFLSIDWRYRHHLSQYNRALFQRNQLLVQLSSRSAAFSQLEYWDTIITTSAAYIHQKRHLFVDYANRFFQLHSETEFHPFSLHYQPSLSTPSRLRSFLKSDLARGHTQIGPHLDDFTFVSSEFNHQNGNLATWGSRGQQRLMVLALRLAQTAYFDQTFPRPSLVLLDDIFSEFDPNFRRLVRRLCQAHQTIVSSSEPDIVAVLPESKVINLNKLG